jgi:hypothetical protein
MKNQNFLIQRKQETDIIGRLAGLNFKQVELLDIPMDIQLEIVEACEDFIEDFPILKCMNIRIKVVDEKIIGINKFATSRIEHNNGILYGLILLNYQKLIDSNLLKSLKLQHKLSFIVADSIRGLVIHELGHLLHYLLDVIFLNLDFKTSITINQFEELINRIRNCATTQTIEQQVLKTNNLSRNLITSYLSKYATRSSKEFIAEALAGYYTTKEPNIVSKSVFQTMKKITFLKKSIRLNLFIYLYFCNNM